MRLADCNSAGYAICASSNKTCNAAKPDLIKSRNSTHSLKTTTALSLLNATSTETYNATEPDFIKYQNSTCSLVVETGLSLVNAIFSFVIERKSDNRLYVTILEHQLPYALGIVFLIVVLIVTFLLISLVLVACFSFIDNRLYHRCNRSRRPSANDETIYTVNLEENSNDTEALINAKYKNRENENYTNIPNFSP